MLNTRTAEGIENIPHLFKNEEDDDGDDEDDEDEDNSQDASVGVADCWS